MNWDEQTVAYIHRPLAHPRMGEPHVATCGWRSPATRCNRPLNHPGLHGQLAPGKEWDGTGSQLGSLWRRPSDSKNFLLVAMTPDGQTYDELRDIPDGKVWRHFYQAQNNCPHISDPSRPCTCDDTDSATAPPEWG